jgi:hypothetical protein
MRKFLLLLLIAIAVIAKGDNLSPKPAGAVAIEKAVPSTLYEPLRSTEGLWYFWHEDRKFPLPVIVYVPADASVDDYLKAQTKEEEELERILDYVRIWEMTRKHAMYDANGKYCP